MALVPELEVAVLKSAHQNHDGILNCCSLQLYGNIDIGRAQGSCPVLDTPLDAIESIHLHGLAARVCYLSAFAKLMIPAKS